MCNFGRGHHEDYFFEIILNLNQWFSRICCIKITYLEQCSLFVQRSGTICVILVEGITRNISVKSF